MTGATGKAADQAIAHVRMSLAGGFFVFGHGGGRQDRCAQDGIADVTTFRDQGRALRISTFAFMICFAAWMLASLTAARAEPPVPEKDELKLGFIKLTDMAPLAIAYEKGFFEDEGLYVTLEPQANWKVLLDRVITGELDGAHMLAGQPLGATIGFGTKAAHRHRVRMDLNGNAITVSNDVWDADEAERRRSTRRASRCTRSRPTR